MFEFADHEAARLTASAARAALFDATNLEQTDIALHPRAPDHERDDEDQAKPEDDAAGPLEVLKDNLSAPISRREFLQGGFLPVDHGSGG
jgi:hypothetical protein